MNRKPIRLAAASAMAALAFGVAAPAATAATHTTAPATASVAAEQTAAQELARTLLTSPETQEFIASLDAADRAELEGIAAGTQGINVGKIVNLLKKVGGYAKAVAGGYETFKNWYNDKVPALVRWTIKGLSGGMSVYDIWWHLSH
ncbi:hypothetical protein AB0H17_29510 [Streptomyces olivoreticuli]